jgi:hypothetical protein
MSIAIIRVMTLTTPSRAFEGRGDAFESSRSECDNSTMLIHLSTAKKTRKCEMVKICHYTKLMLVLKPS